MTYPSAVPCHRIISERMTPPNFIHRRGSSPQSAQWAQGGRRVICLSVTFEFKNFLDGETRIWRQRLLNKLQKGLSHLIRIFSPAAKQRTGRLWKFDWVDSGGLPGLRSWSSWSSNNAMKLSLSDKLTCHAYIIQAAAAALAANFHSQGGNQVPTPRGKSVRRRTRRLVAEIYNCLGPIYFGRAFEWLMLCFGVCMIY